MKHINKFQTLQEYEDAIIPKAPNVSYIVEDEGVRYAEDPKIPNKYIIYTSSDGQAITPCATKVFGASLISNNYDDFGLISFDGAVTMIGFRAFYDCPSLTSVTIPESAASIGGWAFSYCSKLTSITIPNSVTGIGSYAFDGCTSLTSISIPNSVTSIGDNAFDGTAVYNNESNWESGILYIGNCLIAAKSNISGTCAIKDGTRLIGGYAFYGCSKLTSITIPDSVTSIGGSAFRNCSSLTSPVYNAHCFAYMPGFFSGAYTIPDGIKQIAGGAFHNCTSLTSITIPDSVTSIGDYAVYECPSLTSVTIGNGVTSIGEYAFYGCRGLTSITIPDSVTSIGGSAFFMCSSLTSITCEATTPPMLGSSNDQSSVTAVYVPAESVDAYKAATNWSYYASKIQAISENTEQ